MNLEAIFRHGQFEPLGAVPLEEEQRVRLSVDTISTADLSAWLGSLRTLHDVWTTRRGPLPDSTPDIAADRMR